MCHKLTIFHQDFSYLNYSTWCSSHLSRSAFSYTYRAPLFLCYWKWHPIPLITEDQPRASILLQSIGKVVTYSPQQLKTHFLVSFLWNPPEQYMTLNGKIWGTVAICLNQTVKTWNLVALANPKNFPIFCLVWREWCTYGGSHVHMEGAMYTWKESWTQGENHVHMERAMETGREPCSLHPPCPPRPPWYPCYPCYLGNWLTPIESVCLLCQLTRRHHLKPQTNRLTVSSYRKEDPEQ